MRYLSFMIVVWTAATTPFAVRGQTASGPEVGGKAAPLKAAAGTGERAGQDVDFVADRGDKPTVFVFVRADKWDRPAARYLRAIDQALVKGVEGAEDAAAVAIWLTDDVETAKQYVPTAQQSLQLERTTFAVHPGDRFGPKGWSINGEAHVTTVVVRSGKVVASFGYLSLNETNVPEVVKALGKKADK